MTNVQCNAAFSLHIGSVLNLLKSVSIFQFTVKLLVMIMLVRDGPSQSHLSHPSLFKAWLPLTLGVNTTGNALTQCLPKPQAADLDLIPEHFAAMAGTLWLFSTRYDELAFLRQWDILCLILSESNSTFSQQEPGHDDRFNLVLRCSHAMMAAQFIRGPKNYSLVLT